MSDETVYYFDNNATTQVAPEVLEALLPFYTEQWGNPSSAYKFGSHVGDALATAREQVATLLNCDVREVIFTSCGTESNNAAFNNALLSQPGRRHIVTTAVEHSANIKFGQTLEKRGCEVTWLPVDSLGELDVHLLHESIREDTALVSVMYANNETGVVFPLEEIAAICRSKGVLFHTDAVQTPGKLPVDVRALGIDYLSLSAHKLHATKEGGGSLLDETMVLLGSNLGNASSHSNVNLPIIFAGGGFKHGQHLAFDAQKNAPLAKLFVTMMQRMGIEEDRFASGKGTLPGLEVRT